MDDKDLLAKLTNVALVAFHWWDAQADDYSGEYRDLPKDLRTQDILFHDLIAALEVLTPDYFEGYPAKPTYDI